MTGSKVAYDLCAGSYAKQTQDGKSGCTLARSCSVLFEVKAAAETPNSRNLAI